MNEAWLTTRLDELKKLSAMSDHQKMLLLLAGMPHRNSDSERKYLTLARAEWALDRAEKARAKATALVDADKEAVRKLLRRGLEDSAQLLVMSGLVDTGTGAPLWPRAELLGGLQELAESNPEGTVRSRWSQRGEELMTELKEKAARRGACYDPR